MGRGGRLESSRCLGSLGRIGSRNRLKIYDRREIFTDWVFATGRGVVTSKEVSAIRAWWQIGEL